MGLGEEALEALLIHVNLAMQVLDEQGLSPYRTFDSIGRFADLLTACRGDAFSPPRLHPPHHGRDDRHAHRAALLAAIRPLCRAAVKTLFVDTGYACYEKEMLRTVSANCAGF